MSPLALGLANAAAPSGRGNPQASAIEYGLYWGFFQPPTRENAGDHEASAKLLSSLGFKQYQGVGVFPQHIPETLDFFQMMHSYGIGCGFNPIAVHPAHHAWQRHDAGDAPSGPAFQAWTNGTAEKALAEYASLDGVARDIFLGHEVFKWADRQLRAHIVTSCRAVLPKTRTRMYYAQLTIPNEFLGQEREIETALGIGAGKWDDFAITGKTVEPDVLHFAIGELGDDGARGVKQKYDLNREFLQRVLPGREQFCHLNLRESALMADQGQSDLAEILAYLRQGGARVLLFRTVDENVRGKRRQIRASERALELLSGAIRA